LLKGTDPDAGVDETYLSQPTTRMQLATLYSRWLAFEDEASAFTEWRGNFIDCGDGTSRAEQNTLAYYYAHPELGFIGVGDGFFEPQAQITNKQFAKIILTAMGFEYGKDFDWDEILQYVYDVGIDVGTYEDGVWNADIADYLVQSLEDEIVDTKTNFAQYLIDLGVITKEDCIKFHIGYNYHGDFLDPIQPGN